MKVWTLFLVLYLLACGSESGEMPPEGDPDQRVLVFTKTTEYRHSSISDGVSLIRRLGRTDGFKVDRTEDAADFNTENLERYDLVIFLSTTGDVLSDAQQIAFEAYMENGGNFMGVHSAVDTEYDWPWYGRLIGAYFNGHPEIQPAVLHVEDPDHPSTAPLPLTWERTDEWYDFREVQDDIKVLLTVDEDSYEGGQMGDLHPFAWYRETGNSRIFYTAGGHTSRSFREPLFEAHIRGAVLWCLKRSRVE